MKKIGYMAVATLILGSCGQSTDYIKIVAGTYGNNIHTYSLNCETLEFTPGFTAEAENASYALAGENGCIYAVSETGNGSGAYSFSLDNGMEMTAEKRQTGADPCFVLLHEGYMMTADYSGGSVSVFPIKENGEIGDIHQQLAFQGNGPVTGRQEGSHIHQLRVIPGHKDLILASDLGADRIRLLQFSASDGRLAHLSDVICPAGSGPRHMEFSTDGRILYCIAELSGEVLVYSMNHTGSEFSLIQQIQADEVNAGGSADIHIHPDGRHLYTSHRLDNDGIAIFDILSDGTLEKTGYARTARHPRNFMITADGSHLLVACRDDKVIQVFSVGKDGSLTLTPSVLIFDNDMPSSVTAIP